MVDVLGGIVGRAAGGILDSIYYRMVWLCRLPSDDPRLLQKLTVILFSPGSPSIAGSDSSSYAISFSPRPRELACSIKTTSIHS